MTTSTTSLYTTSLDLVDYWAAPAAPLVEPNYTQLSIFDAPAVNPTKNQNYLALIDPLLLSLFVYTCIKYNLFEDELISGLDENSILKHCLKKGHPLNAKLQLLLGLALHTSTKTFKSLVEYLKEQNLDFGDLGCDEAYRYAISMKDVYSIQTPDYALINDICQKINDTRNDQNIIYDKDKYFALVDEINYLSLTSSQTFTVTVTKQIQDDIFFLSKLKDGNTHFGTYLTGVILLLVINFIKANRQLPSNEVEFKSYLASTIAEQSEK
jgi:hypothetical protein